MSRSRATQIMSEEVAAQKNPGPLGEFHLISYCGVAPWVCAQEHIPFLAPCTNLKSGTPNSQFYFLATPKK